jgi:hypothetical protein
MMMSTGGAPDDLCDLRRVTPVGEIASLRSSRAQAGLDLPFILLT